MNWLPRDIEYVISLLTTIIPHIRNVVFVIDAKISIMVNVLPLDNTLDALEKTPCTLYDLLLPSHINNAGAVEVFYKLIVPLQAKNNLKSVRP